MRKFMRVFGIIVNSTTLEQHGFELSQCMYAWIFQINIELALYILRFPISSFNKQQIRMFICCWQNPRTWNLGCRGPTIGIKHHWILVYSAAPVQGDSQESSPTARFKSINSSALSLLYDSTLTSIHDYWKNHSFDLMDICQQSNVSTF